MSASERSSTDLSPIIEESGEVEDEELWTLLATVYVGGGFTIPRVAEELFNPAAVRARGTLMTARNPLTRSLVGIVVLVAPGAAARQIATAAEAEVHLLAVAPGARARGVGGRLITAVIALSRSRGWRQLVLSTQETMQAAQRLYEQAGFSRVPERDWTRAGRRFHAYALEANVGSG